MKKQRYVGVLVKCNNKVLLCKRNREGSFPGMWSIPAGKLEDNETTQEGAKREFFEETGVDIDEVEINFIGLVPRLTRDGKKIKGLMYVYLLDTKTPIEPNFEIAVDGDEHSDWGYFKLKEIRPERTGTHLSKLIQNVLK